MRAQSANLRTPLSIFPPPPPPPPAAPPYLMDHMPATRAEAFPFGLRVLVVDDDPTWLKILEKMLRKCSYEVTTCCLARVALDILRERKDKFDIVISDVNMPDMDGFKLLEHVGLEMDLPVIMMSVDGETSRVMKGVQHGACDYLLKPIRMKELRNIWQHVLRKKIHEVKEIESHDIFEDINFIRNLSGDFDERQLLSGTDLSSLRKRKDMDNREYSDQDLSDSVAIKKARVVWSVDLHQKFVNAVNQIGFDKVGPKKILDLMNVPGLTRENVASHLQKYRLYLSRLQKQNEGRSFGGNVQSDVSKSSQPNYVHQNSIAVPQNTSASRYVCTTQKIQAQGIIPNIHGDDIKSMVSLQVTDRKEAVTSDSFEPQKVNSVSQLDVVLSIKGMVPNADYKPFEPTSKQKPWSGSIPVMQFMQYPKHDHEPYSLLEDYANSPLPSQQAPAGTAGNQLHTPPSVTDKDKQGLSHITPVFMDFRSSHIKSISPVKCKIDSVSVQVEHGVANPQASGTAPEIGTSPCIKDHYFDQPSNCNPRAPSRELGLKDGLEVTSFPDRIGCFENMGLSSMEFFQYNDSATLTEFHSNWCDGLEFNCEYLYDSVIDECLFA